MRELADRYARICERMRVAEGRRVQPAQPARLIAVGKTQPVESLLALYELGQRDFGENYLQELLPKAQAFVAQGYNDVRWHLVGPLQSNKLPALLKLRPLPLLHTLDRASLIQKLVRRLSELRAQEPSLTLDALIELNVDGEASKAGFAPDSLVEALAELFSGAGDGGESGLRLCGVMAIPAPAGSHTTLGGRAAFERLLACADRLSERGLIPARAERMLSYGMSEDFEQAIEWGATHVRIGTALFGPRR